MRWSCLLALFLCTSCGTRLYVETEPYSRKRLASYIVDTPDPAKDVPKHGERINIDWSVDHTTFKKAPLKLLIQIRYRNGEHKKHIISLENASGSYHHPIVGKEYKKNQGLLSWRVALLSEDTLLAEKKHKFWVDPIDIESVD